MSAARATGGAPARVRVPGSTSNVGGGFDCVGIAVARWLEAEAWIEPRGGAPSVARAGTLAALDAAGVAAGDDLLVRGATLACEAAGRALPAGFAIRATSAIPVARGMGSSAAALVAGALLADALCALALGRARVASICASAEGHPDNAGPIVFGGATLGVPRDGGWTFAPLAVHADVGLAMVIPALEVPTRAMRAVLPAQVPLEAAVRAAGKGAALVRGLATADATLLAWALDDVVAVPHRRALLAGYDGAERAALAAGAWGATLSGAGSAMLALAPHERAGAVAAAMADAWRGVGIDAEPWVPAIAGGAEVALPA